MKELRDCLEYLYTNRAEKLPPAGLAEVFDRLIWCLSDNGTQISTIQREWLCCQDTEKVKIALEMDEACPFENSNQMIQVLTSISTKWPELKKKCDEVSARWPQIT